MILNLIKLIKYELKKTWMYIAIFLFLLLCLFSIIDLLSTLTFNLKDSFFSSYKNTYFNLYSAGLDKLDEIEALTDGRCLIDLGLADGYTQSNYEYESFPCFYSSYEFNPLSNVCFFTFEDGSTSYVFEGEKENYINDLKKNGITSDSYKLKEESFLGKYMFFNSSFENNYKKLLIQSNDCLNENSVIINNLIADKLKLKINDKFIMKTDGGDVNAVVSGIYEYNAIENVSFICNIKILGHEITAPSTYSISLRVMDSSIFGNLLKFISSCYEKEQYSYDLTFERYYGLVIGLEATIISLNIVFFLIGLGITYESLNILIKKRTKYIFRLKLMGAENRQIFLIYFAILFIVVIFASIFSYFISTSFTNIVASKAKILFDIELINTKAFISPLVLCLVQLIYFVVIFMQKIRRNNNQITYSLYRRSYD